jgi:hypothetical protein
MGYWNIMYNASKMPSKVFLDCKDDSYISLRPLSILPVQEEKGDYYLFSKSIGPNLMSHYLQLCLQLGISRCSRRWGDHPRIRPLSSQNIVLLDFGGVISDCLNALFAVKVIPFQ